MILKINISYQDQIKKTLFVLAISKKLNLNLNKIKHANKQDSEVIIVKFFLIKNDLLTVPKTSESVYYIFNFIKIKI